MHFAFGEIHSLKNVIIHKYIPIVKIQILTRFREQNMTIYIPAPVISVPLQGKNCY